MPAFTFEKISPPVRRGPTTPEPRKPRGVIYQMIDRLAEMRTRRSLRVERKSMRHDGKPPE
jgi:hypothetical protein